MSGLLQVDCAERRAAVKAFDARYGQMEGALWCLSRHCRGPLLAGTSSPAIEQLVWKLKSWWGVQGVRSESRALISQALASQRWTPALFEAADGDSAFASARVLDLVDKSMKLGVPRREFSLCSKVLHWLMPWQVPVFDSFACRALDIPASWEPERAYPALADRMFAAVRATADDGCDWLSSGEPASPLRGFDKVPWRRGGGETDTAVIVTEPWRAIRDLGIDPEVI